MSTVKISQLPTAGTLSGSDPYPLVDNGVTVRASAQSTPYQSTLVGSVNRTVWDKLAESVSVLDFGAKGDLTQDDAPAIQAAIDSGAHRIRIPFAGGTYRIDSEILIQNRDNIELIADEGVTLQCMGAYSSGRSGIKIDNGSGIKIENLNIRGYCNGWSGSIADIANAPIDFGVYSTSTGTGAAGNNRFVNVQTNWCRIAGFCVGNNDPLVIDETTDEHQLYQCAPSYTPIGVKVVQTNTNMTRIVGGWVTNFTQYGVYIGNGARGVTVDNVMFYTFASFGGIANIYIDKKNNGPVMLCNIVTEQYQGAWLKTEGTNAAVTDFNLLSIINCNVTNNDTTVGQKLIDYKGAGSVMIKNCRFGGAGTLRAGGVGATLSFQPTNAAIGGMQWLTTELVELYDGATWDVQTDNGNAWMRWLDIGTTTRAGNSGEGDPSTPLIRERGKINHEIQTLTAIALASGGTQNSYGAVTRNVWKVTVAKTAFTAAAATHSYYVATLPAKTRVVAVYADTTEKYAGLAGTIQLAVQIGATDLLVNADVKTAAVTQGLVGGDLGAALSGAVQGAYIPSWSGATQVAVKLTSGTGNIGNGTTTNLTTGSTTVYLITESMPAY